MDTTATSNQTLSPKKVLLVDDHDENRVLINIYLKKSNYQLEVAENGEIGFEKFKSKEFDIVLMDIQMPVMDGYVATKAIRLWEKENSKEATPIIALTANDAATRGQESLDAGCNFHLSKPIKKDILLKMLDEYCK